MEQSTCWSGIARSQDLKAYVNTIVFKIVKYLQIKLDEDVKAQLFFVVFFLQ